MMEKLTAMRNGVTVYVGPGCEYETGMISAELRSEHVRQVLNRLAAYEKTGLEPEEVHTMCSMDRRTKMADLLRLESYQSLGTFEELAALVNRTSAQACGMCINEHTDPELNSDNDLSYISIGEHEKGYRALLRSGDGRPTAILFEKWTDGAGWTTIGHYQPKYCPNCGRELKENDHGPRKRATKIEARPWKPQDLLDDLQSIIDEETDSYLNTRRTTLCMARDYLKEYFASPSNDPLTLEELREMSGKPVWTQRDLFPDECRWRVIREVYDLKLSFTDGSWLFFSDFGKSWLAYRSRPEEVQHETD